MYRSSSSTRVSDEFFSNSPPLSSQTATESEVLPILNPHSDVAKKEKYRLRSAQNAVHLIPVVLTLCAIILWFFSGPVNMANKSDSIVPGYKTPVIENVDIGLSKSTLKPKIEQGDIDSDNQSSDSQGHKSAT